MTIFEIDRQKLDLIENSVDPETGELILDESQLEALQMDRDRKIENLLMLYKDTLAQSKVIKDEIENLKGRQSVLDNKAERLKRFAENVLKGEKFETAKVKVSYRSSEAVEISDSFIAWAKANRDDLLKYKEPEIDKKAVKDALKNNEEIVGAALTKKLNMQVK